MPRPISWLDRIPAIRNSVANDSRSHYERKDLEVLFGLQVRSAQQLLEVLPTTLVGRSPLVERQVLLDFLNGVYASETPSEFISGFRGRYKAARRTLQLSASPAVATPDHPPANVRFRPGHIEIDFQSVDEIAKAMLGLAQILENHLPEFAELYEVRPAPSGTSGRADVEEMFRQLEQDESAYREQHR